MKTIAKFSLIALFFATFAGFAQAGDPAPRWNAELQRQRQAERNWEKTSVAVYSKGGVGQRMMQADRGETHLEIRANAHGQTSVVQVPGRK